MARKKPPVAGGFLFDLFALVLLKFGQLPVEAVDPSVSPDGTLLAGVEGVAVRAGVNLDLFQGGTGLEGASAARASHHTVVISGVDSFFHCFAPFAVLLVSTESTPCTILETLTGCK